MAWEGEPPGWASLLGAVLAIVGFVVSIGSFVHAVRSGRYRANRDSRLWELSWSRRRQLMRQV